MSKTLLETYTQARYVLQVADKLLEFRVGQNLDLLNQILDAQDCQSAIFITAFNPQSETYPLDINLKSNRMLLREIKHSGYRHLTGFGHDDANLWPKEPNFFVLGIEREHADRLAELFKQNAYLWICIDSPVELVSLMT